MINIQTRKRYRNCVFIFWTYLFTREDSMRFYFILFAAVLFIVGTYIEGNCKVFVDVKARISIRLQLKKSSATGVGRAMFYGYC